MPNIIMNIFNNAICCGKCSVWIRMNNSTRSQYMILIYIYIYIYIYIDPAKPIRVVNKLKMVSQKTNNILKK